MLNPEEVYHRKKSILYNSKNVQILKFRDITVEAENLTGVLVDNMNNYIRCYPERVDILEHKKEDVQLNLF